MINENGDIVGLNIGSDNRDVSVEQDGFYSGAITLNDVQEFLGYFYGKKTVAKQETPVRQAQGVLSGSRRKPVPSVDIFADKCVWQKTKEGQWCRHE